MSIHLSLRSITEPCRMKVLLLTCLFVLLAAGIAWAETYTTKYDNIDIDEILNNQRLYKKYFDCLSNKGKCTPDGKELKAILPDALATDCQKCSEKQKAGADKVIGFVLEKKPTDYDLLEKLYDPSGNYKKKFLAKKESKA
uniref:Chemosensory protein 12 n=1 Tax=Yemma signatus TaxID=300820 RepID=A0A3G2GRT2_9HEMI|nr:chemosensory protein 12 [Yemma signatus]